MAVNDDAERYRYNKDDKENSQNYLQHIRVNFQNFEIVAV